MGYETETDTAQTTAGDRIESVGLEGNGYAVFFGPLPEDAVIVGGAGCFQLQWCFFPLVIEPVKGTFIFGCINFLIDNEFAASGGYQKKDMMGHCTQIDGQFLYFGDLIQIGFGDGCVDLKFHANFF